MSTIKTNKLFFHINIQGEGEPLFLIHGLGLDQTLWNDQIPYLSKNYKVITYDVRGHGQTTHPQNYNLNDHADDLADIMTKLQIESAHIAGISMGSYIAQHFVIKYPEKVKKVVLAATKGYGKTSSMQTLIDEKRAKGERVELDTILNISANACFRDGGTKEQLEKFYHSSRYNTLESYIEAMKALRDFDFRADLPNIKAPTLVINGDLDVLTTLDQAKEVYSLLANSVLEVLDGCGHLCNIEASETFNRKVVEFLTT
jgi:3-oxoadipate enol-lactonase